MRGETSRREVLIFFDGQFFVVPAGQFTNKPIARRSLQPEEKAELTFCSPPLASGGDYERVYRKVYYHEGIT